MTAPGRTVVLGGTGYLGSEVVAALAAATPGTPGAAPRQVVTVGRRATTSTRPPGSPGAAHVQAISRDLSVPGAAADLVAGADVVIHLVAPSGPTTTWRTAGDGAELALLAEVLEATATRSGEHGRVPPLVMLASTVPPASAAGQPAHAPSDHERRKQALEELLAEAATQGRVRSATLRLSTVYGVGAGGPGRGVVASMARQAVRGRPLTVWHGADVRRNLVHVRDAATAFVRAARCGGAQPTAPVWSVGGPDQLSVRELAELVAVEAADVSGVLVPVESVPAPDWAVPADFLDVVVDREPFERATGWRPAATLRAGVRDLVSYIQTAERRRSDR
ncbi:NAD-dependent epimerase/dehydratase family protein [Georgenia sunbinii]|uniref:NAD-dependent epimerase/dehydratase family protein n=1 Tax=Georgenia sunbinii TaxID=3117728 RepID=UPI002F267BD7